MDTSPDSEPWKGLPIIQGAQGQVISRVWGLMVYYFCVLGFKPLVEGTMPDVLGSLEQRPVEYRWHR